MTKLNIFIQLKQYLLTLNIKEIIPESQSIVNL